MCKIEDIKKEINRAYQYFAIGSDILFGDTLNNNRNISDIAKGYESIQKGANILNAISLVAKKSGCAEQPFPTDMKAVLDLIENKSVSEWKEIYPVFTYDDELSNEDYNFSIESFLGSTKDRFYAKNEFMIYEEFNNNISFRSIRAKAADDSEYAFSRAYIPTILEGSPSTIIDTLRWIWTRNFEGDISSEFLGDIIKNYYEPVDNYSSYYYTKDGLAVCACCGSLMKKTPNGDITCSFDKCRHMHLKKGVACSISHFIGKPTLKLKYEVLRYVKFPSIEELDMFDKLKKKYVRKQLIESLILYYKKDSCDISFTVKGRRFALDLKEWENPYDLAESLNETNFKRNNQDAQVFLIIPNYLTRKSNGRKNNYKETLLSLLTDEVKSEIGVYTVKEFFSYLDSIVKGDA